MIFGIGCDLIDTRRIERVLAAFGDRFVHRLLGPSERQDYAPRHGALELAKRWAAKEAFLKALGTGLRGISWHDLALKRSPSGQPFLTFSQHAQRRLETKTKQARAHLSLSDEPPYVLAFVILERP